MQKTVLESNNASTNDIAVTDMGSGTKENQGKNELWGLYRNADSLVRDEIILELKKAGLFRHWWETASKAGYDLKNAKATLRDIFVRLLPESAPEFGLPAPKGASKRPKPPVVNAPTLFD